jgi:hypothetical protein
MSEARRRGCREVHTHEREYCGRANKSKDPNDASRHPGSEKITAEYAEYAEHKKIYSHKRNSAEIIEIDLERI